MIHADLFPDNVFFLGERLSGLIDFYFACNDMLAYDVAICLNAWCFENDYSYNVTKGRALLQAYAKVRPLSDAELDGDAAAGARRGVALPADAPGRLARTCRRARWCGRKRRRNISASCASTSGEERAAITASRLRELTRESPHVIIHTDGACSGNPGPGGWGAILSFGDHEKELKGGEAHTTNNRMELMAAISALEALKKPCGVDLHTDSQYVRNGISGWIHEAGRSNGWRTADKKPVKNADLWQRLDAAIAHHEVRWHWVKGHAGHELNERADQLARATPSRK